MLKQKKVSTKAEKGFIESTQHFSKDQLIDKIVAKHIKGGTVAAYCVIEDAILL